MSKIIWSDRTRKDLIEIKAFYDERNNSDVYSKKVTAYGASFFLIALAMEFGILSSEPSI